MTTPLVSLLCESTFFGGWPSAFYLFGLLSCLWFIGWIFYAYNSPAEHPRISSSEKVYLLRCIPRAKKVFKNRKYVRKLTLYFSLPLLGNIFSLVFLCTALRFNISVQILFSTFY